MAAPKSQRDNADAFDDLLGQLVDELAMTPTMVPDPEPEPEPTGTPTGGDMPWDIDGRAVPDAMAVIVDIDAATAAEGSP